MKHFVRHAQLSRSDFITLSPHKYSQIVKALMPCGANAHAWRCQHINLQLLCAALNMHILYIYICFLLYITENNICEEVNLTGYKQMYLYLFM